MGVKEVVWRMRGLVVLIVVWEVFVVIDCMIYAFVVDGL
jgi:hypothetical protein